MDKNSHASSDAEIIEIFGELLEEHTADLLQVPEYFHVICLGATDFDDVLDLLTGDQEEDDDDDDEWEDSGWGAYEEDIDFGFTHIKDEEHRQQLRDGVPYAELAKHYTQEQILKDLDSLSFVMIYCKQRGEKIYRIRTVDDLPKLFARYPETLINVCAIGS